MHVDEMEKPNDAKNFRAGNSALLAVFWTLAEGEERERLVVTQRLVDILKEKQTENAEPCRELVYSVDRLVKGLSSNRKFARLGFSAALTTVLRAFPIVTTEAVLTLIRGHLKIPKHDKKEEQNAVLLGQVFAYISLIKSGNILQASESEVQHVVSGLITCGASKAPLQHVCCQALSHLISGISSELFSRAMWPKLSVHLKAGWVSCTAEQMLLLITAVTHHKKIVGKSFLRDHWGTEKLLTEKTVERLISIITKSTSIHPTIHGVCERAVSLALKSSHVFGSFWKCLAKALLEGTPQRKYLLFKLVPLALSQSKSAEQVQTILTPAFMKTLAWNLTRKDVLLKAAAQHTVQELVQCVQRQEDSEEIQLTIIWGVLSSNLSVNFDNLTRTKTVSTMVTKLSENASLKWVEFLKKVLVGGTASEISTEEEDDEDEVEMRRKWAASSLAHYSTLNVFAKDPTRLADILKFLFLFAFFDVHKTSKDIDHCGQKPGVPLKKTTQQAVQDSLFKAITKLASEHKKHPDVFADIVHRIALYGERLLKDGGHHVKVSHSLSNKGRNQWDRLMMAVEGLGNHSDLTSEIKAFRLLFLLLALQLIANPSASKDLDSSIDDLLICCQKAVSKKGKISKVVKQGEPSWVEVVMEVLLSLLTQPSLLIRTVVSSVFTLLCPSFTPEAMNQLVEALQSNMAGGTLDVADEDMESDDNEELEELDEDNEEEESEEDSEEEKDSAIEDEYEGTDEEEEQEEEVVEEEFRASLKAALGNAAEDSESDTDDDLDDDTMMKLDDALSAAFRSMKKGRLKKKDDDNLQRQLKHYKLRCLDLVDNLARSTPPSSVLLNLVKPLLQLMDSGMKDKTLSEQGRKAAQIFHFICKCKYASDSSCHEKIPVMVADLVDYSKKVSGVDMVKEVAVAVDFTVKTLVGTEHSAVQSPGKSPSKGSSSTSTNKSRELVINTLRTAILDYAHRRDLQYHHILFYTILERQGSFLWPLSDDLLALGTDSSIKLFIRTQILSMLAGLLNKNTVQAMGDEWQPFTVKLLKAIQKGMDIVKEEHISSGARYVHELVLLLHRAASSCAQFVDTIPDELIEEVNSLQKLGRETRNVLKRLRKLLGTRGGSTCTTPMKRKSFDEDETTAEMVITTPSKRVKNGHGSVETVSPMSPTDIANDSGTDQQNHSDSSQKKFKKKSKKKHERTLTE